MNTQKEKKIKLLLENWAGEIADILRYEEEGQGIEEDLKDKI